MTTPQLLLFLAAFAQVALTIYLYLRLLLSRVAAVRGGGLDFQRLAYDSSAWPEKPRVFQNAVASQFELPVLFYVAVALTYSLGAINWLAVILAWVFVVARIVHAVIHTGPNVIMPRLRAFQVSMAAVVLFWLYLLFHVVSGWLILA